jgi:putative transcriptional regulator
MSLRRYSIAFACGLFLAFGALCTARAGDISKPVLLVASPELGEFYRGAVLLARPVGGGGHIGFIINRPTPVTLGKLFPEHELSQKVTAPVFLGGPFYLDVLFAMVHRRHSPGGRSFALADNLFLVTDVDVVDRIIEQNGNDARFLVGLVAWQPGELEIEVQRNVWYVLEPDADLVFRKSTDGLWEELVRRSRSAV